MKTYAWKDLKQHPDLVILLLACFLCTIGGLIWGNSPLLQSITIALLGVLAFSQLNSRAQIDAVARGWNRNRTDLLLKDFPPEYTKAQKEVAASYFFAGLTMSRTLPLMEPHIDRVLKNDGSVQILLPNPENAPLMSMIAKMRPYKDPQTIKAEISNSIQKANGLRNKGNLEVRTVDYLPGLSFNVMDADRPQASLMVQVYEFGADRRAESAPIVFLTPSDGEWFEHFKAQASRLWETGSPLPPN